MVARRPRSRRWVRTFGAALCLYALGAVLWRAGVGTPLPIVYQVDAHNDPKDPDTLIVSYPHATAWGDRVSPDGHTLARIARMQPGRRLSGVWDPNTPALAVLAIWDVPTRRLVKVARCEGDIGDARFLAGGALLAVATLDRRRDYTRKGPVDPGARCTLSLWDAQRGRRLWEHSVAAGNCFFDRSLDGSLLACALETHTGWEVRVLQTATGRLVRTLQGVSRWPIEFSPDGRLLAVSRETPPAGTTTLVVYDTATWQPRLRLESPLPQAVAVVSPAFSRDGNRVAALFDSRPQSCAGVWDVETGRQIFRVRAPVGRWLGEPLFSADGAVLSCGELRLDLRIPDPRPRWGSGPAGWPLGEALPGSDLRLFCDRAKPGRFELWDTRAGVRRKVWSIGKADAPIGFAPQSGTLTYVERDYAVRQKRLR